MKQNMTKYVDDCDIDELRDLAALSIYSYFQQGGSPNELVDHLKDSMIDTDWEELQAHMEDN